MWADILLPITLGVYFGVPIILIAIRILRRKAFIINPMLSNTWLFVPLCGFAILVATFMFSVSPLAEDYVYVMGFSVVSFITLGLISWMLFGLGFLFNVKVDDVHQSVPLVLERAGLSVILNDRPLDIFMRRHRYIAQSDEGSVKVLVLTAGGYDQAWFTVRGNRHILHKISFYETLVHEIPSHSTVRGLVFGGMLLLMGIAISVMTMYQLMRILRILP